MRAWPKYPVILEINTWPWLDDLSRQANARLDLATVPPEQWDAIASQGFDIVWLMGVWERSPAGIDISMRNEALVAEFRNALPDFTAQDNIGSAYCVREYVVDERLGGPKGLAAAREALARRGIRLILDFVPNHVAVDHPWVRDHPSYLVRGNSDDVQRDPTAFVQAFGSVFACGRDPFFPPWSDVLQLNAFVPSLRQAIIDTIATIAEQCDGVRCDMAMLVLNDVFERTWGLRAGARPAEEYWRTVIPAVKGTHPDFRFIAEAYWDLEWELQQQGFDYCYDKKLYDRMEHGSAEDVRLHLLADSSYQDRMVRFLENHDERRAALGFPDAKGRAAAVALLTLPGARLLHEGQMEGAKVRLPVFLRRRPAEPVDRDLADFYRGLLRGTGDLFRNGEWRLCDRSGWPDNQSCRNILAWCWANEDQRAIVLVNFGPEHAQARVHVPWDWWRHQSWSLDDVLSGVRYEREGTELHESGLYVDLAPWHYHLLEVHAV